MLKSFAPTLHPLPSLSWGVPTSKEFLLLVGDYPSGVGIPTLQSMVCVSFLCPDSVVLARKNIYWEQVKIHVEYE